MKPRLARLAALGRFPGWLPEFLILRNNRVRTQARLLALAGLVGIVAGVGAIVFYVATRVVEHYALGVVAGYYPSPRPGGEAAMTWLSVVQHPLNVWLLLVIPTVGGLCSGILVFTMAPEAEGHGTDSAISAYHHHQGQIRPRVPLVKIVASALTLGTGGSGGREGPIAQIGAGFGSLLGNLLRLRPAERRVLMAAGMGSGIGAIFRAPLAGTMFAAEVLYRSPEFEPEVIIRAFLASEQMVVTLHPGDPFATVLDRLSNAPLSVLPVVDSESRLLGVVDLEEVHLAAQTPSLKPLILAEDLMRSDIRPLTPDDTLDRGLELFVENDLLVLPVVDDLKARRVLAMVRRFDIASAYLRHIHGDRSDKAV